MHSLNFAPRTTIPVQLLGTPPEDKRLALLEGGHIPARMEDVIREVLDSLDRYPGPVRAAGGSAAAPWE